MKEKILLVDDEPNILAAYERTLHSLYTVETATSGELGLQALEQRGPYAVIVADMRMTGMDGIQFLAAVRERTPECVRIMLTGNADLEMAIKVVNEGNIFRFLTKPCTAALLVKALQDAVTQFQLINAERELLEKTLSGSLKVLTDILSMADPQSFGRAQLFRDSIQSIARHLRLENTWELNLAAMLAQIGAVTIPPTVILKSRAGSALTKVEQDMLVRIPEISRNLLSNIPRLEGVARIVLYQNKHFDGGGYPTDPVRGEAIPLGARLLKILFDLAQLESRGLTRAKAFHELRLRQGWYDLRLLEAVAQCFAGLPTGTAPANRDAVPVMISQLRTGHVLRSNVETTDGMLLASAPLMLSPATLEMILNFARVSTLKEPIFVDRTL